MVGRGCGGSEAAGGGKRGRCPEEDVYADNLHSHKRYLSEIMAFSMNGLSVGDSAADNTIVSPVRLENASCFRDEYSHMSEESDDYRYYDGQSTTNVNQTDAMSSPSTSPISSPHGFQKPDTWLSSANPYPLPSCSLAAVVCLNTRHGTEHEGPIPFSPSDMWHGEDLRRTALLRSVQMRVQGPHAYDLLFESGHEQEQEHAHARARELEIEYGSKKLGGVKLEQRSSCFPKSIQDAEFRSSENCDQCPEHDADCVEECQSDYGVTGPMFNRDNICGKLCVNVDERR